MVESLRTRDGRRLTFRRVGHGPVLICHPGGPGYSADYLADVAGLGDAFSLILLDPRGTGDSDTPQDPRAYATSDYVADVEDLRVHLGEDRLDLLGHSHGGIVTMAYAAAHPERTRRLVALDTLVRWHPEEWERLLPRHRDEPWYEAARAAFLASDADDIAEDGSRRSEAYMPLYFSRYDARARRYVEEVLSKTTPNDDPLRLFGEDETWDMRPALASIEAPTLVVTGEHDLVAGPACADDIADGIRGSRLVLIEACGHFSFIEQPERVRELVTEFLRPG
jgi:proline-specific peptidase